MTMATTKRNDIQADGHLHVVRSLSSTLIRTRIRESCDKAMLDRAIRTSVRGGASVDSLSEASGYPPELVREISESQDCNEDLATLAGIA